LRLREAQRGSDCGGSSVPIMGGMPAVAIFFLAP
jgi:hypothetical protein